MTSSAELSAFRAAYGVLGEQECRTFRLERSSVKESSSGEGQLKIVGHAAVFGSPSLAMTSPLGKFTEYIARGAFDAVLARNPDVLLTWDHDTRLVLARTHAGTLELSTNAHGLRYFARVSDTTYSRDLKTLIADGVVTQSSFLFTVAKEGETWDVSGSGTVTRTINQIGELFDVCCCAAGMYSATSSGIARSLALEYAQAKGYLRALDPTALRRAQLRETLELRKRRLL